MNAQIVRGHFAGIPHGKTVVNIDSADVATLLGAATGLAQAIAGVALAGAGAVLGIKLISELISGMLQSFNTKTVLAHPNGNDPKLPLGSSPCWIEVNGCGFWGIVLDQDLVFSVGGSQKLIPYSMVYELEFKVGGFFNYRDEMRVNLVDGSRYYGFRERKDGRGNNVWPDTSSIRVTAIGGIQDIPVKREIRDSFLWWDWVTGEEIVPVKFTPPRVTDVTVLRDNLKQVLTHNGQSITNLIGSNVLQSYFSVSSIP